jgi:DnaK suppressor protein
MPSTSISLPAVRRSPAIRHRGASQVRVHQAQARAAQPGAVQPGTVQPRHGGHTRAGSARPAQAARAGLARRRAQLEARWRERLDRVTALSLAFHDEAQRSAPGRAGGGGESRRARQLARQTVAERQALAEIEAALDRIATGRYGWCEQCGRPIAVALLAARPQARYCVPCGRQAMTQRIACA